MRKPEWTNRRIVCYSQLLGQCGQQFAVELEGPGSGIYFIAVTDGNTRLQTRFVKK